MHFSIEGIGKNNFFWAFVYFHGQLHKDNDDNQDPWEHPGDLVSCNVSHDRIRDGIHKGSFGKRVVNVYLWSHSRKVPSFVKTEDGSIVDTSYEECDRRGLIVYEDDAEANEFAKKKFEENSPCL